MTQNAIALTALTLGIEKEDGQKYTEGFLQQSLKHAGINASFHYFSSKEDAFRAIVKGEIAACALNTMPTSLPLGLVITALSERKVANNCLVAKITVDVRNPDSFGEGVLFSEKNDVKVLTLSDINRAQMQYLQPNYTVEKADLTPLESLEKLNSGAFDAIVLSQIDVKMLDLQADLWQIQPFSVREFIPKAGQGVTCFIAAEDDLPTRRLLKEAHHPSVSAVTNIERTIQKMLNDNDVSAYCERDRMGNYHLWAAALVNNAFRKIRLSQSTTFGMAEKAVQQLLSA